MLEAGDRSGPGDAAGRDSPGAARRRRAVPRGRAAQAAAAGHSTDAELHLLCTHGILHLLGYDHDDAEAEREMFELQAALVGEWAAATGRGPIQAPRAGHRRRGARHRRPAASATERDERRPTVTELVIAICLVPIGGALACFDSALTHVSPARVEEMVREGRRGREAAAAHRRRPGPLHQPAAAAAGHLRADRDRAGHRVRRRRMGRRLAGDRLHGRGDGGRFLRADRRRAAHARAPAPVRGRARRRPAWSICSAGCSTRWPRC